MDGLNLARSHGLVLRGAQLVGQAGLVDLAVMDDLFVPLDGCSGLPELDLQGRLVIPGFVDAHMHLDKAFALENGLVPGDSLPAAIQNFYHWRSEISPLQVYHNARRTAEQALLSGTLALRTHTTVDQSVGLSWLESLLKVKEELSAQVTIQIVVFPDSNELINGKAENLLREALAAGVDALGGAPLMCSAPQQATDLLFELAGEAGCDLDLHIDESDDPNAKTLEYLADRKIALGFSSRVVAGHCTSLSAMTEGEACRVIEKVARAGLFIITLPSCNLYLMGRNDRGLVRRGLTRVHELLAAGVRVSFASDNVRDAFNPFGSADMLQQALICAHALHMGSPAELELLLQMGTCFPAQALGIEDVSLKVGNPASFVVLDSTDWAEALARLVPRRYVFSRGVLVAETIVDNRLVLSN